MEEVGARVSLKGARAAQRDAKGVSREVRGIGDSGSRASRRLLTMTTATRGLTRATRALAFGAGVATAAIGGAAFVAGRHAVNAASDLGEEINKTSVVFRGSERDILQWSRATADGLGISRREALQSAGVFGNMLVPMGVARDRAGQMSTRMVDLAADMASFNNADPSEVLDSLRAGLAGETEPLRRFGVFLSAARVEEEALRLGLAKGKKDIDASAKAQATYSLILKDTKDAQGDFARTSESLPNLQRRIRANTENLSAAFGKGLTPGVERAADALNDLIVKVTPAAENIGEAVSEILFTSNDLSAQQKVERIFGVTKAELGPVLRPFTAAIGQEVGRIDFGKAASGAIEQGAPVMADAFARQVPRMASAFANAFVNAGPGGQLLTVGLLAAKFGAFRTVGGWAAGQFLTTFRRQATTAGTFGSVGRFGGRALGDGLVVYGAGEVKKGARGGRFDRAGQMAGAAMGVAGAAYMAKELGDGLRKYIDDASRKGGIEGFLGSLGGVVDDVTRGGGKLGQFGPQAPIIAATKDAKRRLDGRPKTKTVRPVNIPSPMGNGQRQGSIGRGADVTSRSAGFGLPGARTSMPDSFEATIVLQLPDGQKQNVKAEMRRARRR